MGWLSKIFKGSSHKLSEEHCRENYGEDPNNCGPSCSGEVWSENENEDIDRAIALSLLEENQKGKIVVGFDSQLEEDEQLARALQESLNVESPPQHGNGNTYQPSTPPQYGNGNTYQPITPPQHGNENTYQPSTPPQYGNGNTYHPITPPHYGNGNTYQPIPPPRYGNGNAYQPIPMYYPMGSSFLHLGITLTINLAIRRATIQNVMFASTLAHPFWVQKYCPSHEHDTTPRCCSCERMEPQDTKYVPLNDGRKLCLECLDSAIMDTSACQPLYLDIQEFYEGLNMKLEQQVPLLLVERQALNEAREGERNGHYHMPETRGLCLSEEQTISTISKRPRFGGGNHSMEMVTEPYKLTRRCEVTAILILYGLPRLLTGSILAHEMMHAWLRLKGYRPLSQDVEEGICQVLAYMWLEAELISGSGSDVASTSSSSTSSATKKGTRSQFEKKLGGFFKHQVESDMSPVYGDGFRAGQQAIQKYGLRSTLDHIRMTGTFPY
ncbi:hypothetical protein PRUPE_1G384500 [Prunus persica]|uniref:Protein DA1-like domain-containing protein n=1 Tax=Prunus persica TaxID=3760 RepID=A0A251R9N9_PRUPE|nr:hypothetical protein PRUPE_1G384500 [Prunus persica]